MEFIDWMRSIGLSDASINNYSGALKGRLNLWATDHALIDKPLLKITDELEFLRVSDGIRKTQEFVSYNTLGKGMYTAALNHYLKYLSVGNFADPLQNDSDLEQGSWEEGFDPQLMVDQRERIYREVVIRRGQPKFRSELIEAYRGQCVVTRCRQAELLEAAHVTPYLGDSTNKLPNGILLRADVHTLWDLGLIAACPDSRELWVSKFVIDPAYICLAGIKLLAPKRMVDQPSTEALAQQWKFASQREVERSDQR